MITDPTEIAFRRAIVAEPHDDVPRMVYADWLQENGQDERAEFIRLQCRLAEMLEDSPDYAAMRKREEKLLRKNKRRWTKPVPWRWRPEARSRVHAAGSRWRWSRISSARRASNITAAGSATGA